jgi:hypothetical protein
MKQKRSFEMHPFIKYGLTKGSGFFIIIKIQVNRNTIIKAIKKSL